MKTTCMIHNSHYERDGGVEYMIIESSYSHEFILITVGDKTVRVKGDEVIKAVNNCLED